MSCKTFLPGKPLSSFARPGRVEDPSLHSSCRSGRNEPTTSAQGQKRRTGVSAPHVPTSGGPASLSLSHYPSPVLQKSRPRALPAPHLSRASPRNRTPGHIRDRESREERAPPAGPSVE